jgi:hypothetical protein
MTQLCHLIIFNLLNLSSRTSSGVYSVSNRSEYQKEEKSFWGVERGRRALKSSLPSMSRLSRQCGILNISQLYRPPRSVTGMAFEPGLLHWDRFFHTCAAANYSIFARYKSRECIKNSSVLLSSSSSLS